MEEEGGRQRGEGMEEVDRGEGMMEERESEEEGDEDGINFVSH